MAVPETQYTVVLRTAGGHESEYTYSHSPGAKALAVGQAIRVSGGREVVITDITHAAASGKKVGLLYARLPSTTR
jgi:hypothetical protein